MNSQADLRAQQWVWKSRMHPKGIAVGPTPGKGKGVFALQRFSQGELIERAPVIVLPDPQWEQIENTLLKDYYLYWTEDSVAVPLGLGMLYNYSERPNAGFVRDYDETVLKVAALRDIQPGEEIQVRYLCPPWFRVIDD